jgi:hypothetical protein
MQSGLLLEHAFRFAKGTLGLTAAKVRTPGQAERWVRLVMAAFAQLVLARPLAADLRRPWERPRDPARPATPARVRRGFPDIRPRLGTPARVGKPTRPGPGRPKGSARGRHPAIQSRRKAAKRTDKKPKTTPYRLKRRLRSLVPPYVLRRPLQWRCAR